MEAKKNLCAMIPAELHAKVVAEKERLELSTLGEYVELILKEHFEGGKTIMAATKTLAFQISEELDQRLKNLEAWPEDQPKGVRHRTHRTGAGRIRGAEPDRGNDRRMRYHMAAGESIPSGFLLEVKYPVHLSR